MPNQLYIDPETPVNGVHTPDEETPRTDGLFVGHRHDENGDLEVMLGQKIGDHYRMAAILCEQDARLLCDRLTALLDSVAQGEEPQYAHPTPFYSPPLNQDKNAK